ncbi:MAG TPA: Gldg family protein [bacterium]
MKNWLKYSGYAALVLGLVSLFIYAVTSTWSLLNWILSILAVLFFIVYAAIELNKIKLFITTRSFRQTSNIVTMSLIVFGILVLLNFIVAKHNFRWDTTRGKLFSISPQSQKIVRSLTSDVRIKAFVRPSNQQSIEDLLTEYASYSKRFKHEIIDPDVHPGLVKEYNIENYGTIIFESQGRIERIKESSEQEITNALIKVTREGIKKIYFTTMHGEHNLDDANPEGLSEAQQAIENENYQVATLFLAETGTVPDDCSVLIIAGPKKDLLESEYHAIQGYLENGGKLVVLLDPEQPDLKQLLSPWGFEVGNNTIIDASPVGQLFGGGYGSPLISKYESHAITEDFNVMTIFRFVRSVTPAEQPGSGITVQSLAKTTEFPGSWAETNLQAEDIQYDEGADQKGPVSIAAVAEQSVSAPPDSIAAADVSKSIKTRISVFGDSDFITNAYFHFQGNGDLFLNVISWLAEQGDLISIRAKDPEGNRVSLNAQQANIIFWFGVILLPLSILTTGIVIYIQRK